MDGVTAEDQRLMSDALDRLVEAHLLVRAVNDRYLEMIATALSPADGAALLSAARRRAFPRLFTPTVPERAFSRTRTLPGVAAATMRAIEALAQSYRIDRDTLDLELLRRTRANEPAELRITILQLWGAPLFEPERRGEELEGIIEQRRDLDRTTLRRLGDLLPPDLAREVPGLSAADD